MTPRVRCGGLLAYETIGGAVLVRRPDGFHARCTVCGKESVSADPGKRSRCAERKQRVAP